MFSQLIDLLTRPEGDTPKELEGRFPIIIQDDDEVVSTVLISTASCNNLLDLRPMLPHPAVYLLLKSLETLVFERNRVLEHLR